MRGIQFSILAFALLLGTTFNFACTAAGRTGAAASPSGQIPTEAELKNMLFDELVRLGKIDPGTHSPRVASAPPSGDINRPQMVQSLTMPDGTLRLAFLERLQGDYDLSGEVGVSDITPIALRFLETAAWISSGIPESGEENERRAVVDGDQSGEIGVSDVTPIAINYLQTIAGYNVYRDGVFIPNGADPELPTIPRPTPGGSGWRDGRWPQYSLVDSPGGEARMIVYSLRPVDSDGVEGDAYSYNVNYTFNADSTPPAPPANLSVTQPNQTTIRLEWDDNAEPDLAGYNVYRSDSPGDPSPEKLNTAAIVTASTFDVTDGVTPGLHWYFRVTSVDASDNESGFSNEADIVVQDVPPINPPTGLASFAGDGQVRLTWDDPADPNIVGHNLYMSTDEFDPAPPKVNGAPIAALEYTVSPLTNGTTYYFWLTSLDAALHESGKAGPVNATPQSGANLPPVAVADAFPTSGTMPLTVNFSAGESSDPDGNIAWYRWDYTDDGLWDFESETDGTTSFPYNFAGIHTARLEVEDDDGATSQDAVQITVTAGDEWNTLKVASWSNVRSLSLAFDPDGRPTVAAGVAGLELALEVYEYNGADFVGIGSIGYGGRDAVQLAISGDRKYFVGRVNWNEMFEDFGDFSYDIGAGWTDKSYGTISDWSKIIVGASETEGFLGYQWLIMPEYTLVHVGNEEFKEFGTGVYNPKCSNLAFESDLAGQTWLCDPANLKWTRAEWNGSEWLMHTGEDLDGQYENIYRIEWLPGMGKYVMALATFTDTPQLAWASWDGATYEFKSTSGIPVLYPDSGAAIGPEGEIYFYQIDESRDPPFKISYYESKYNYSVPQLGLDGPIDGAVVECAAMAVTKSGDPNIVYKLMGDDNIYFAMFPKPQLG
ncbi:MAG: PKD domain-containing protein [bacterium]|jgi:hypothetical protein